MTAQIDHEAIRKRALADALREHLGNTQRSRMFVIEDATDVRPIDTSPIADAVKLAIESIPQPKDVDLGPFTLALDRLADAIGQQNKLQAEANKSAAATGAALARQANLFAELVRTLVLQKAQKIEFPKEAIPVKMPAQPKRAIEVEHADGRKTKIREV